MSHKPSAVVIGAGIGGLSIAALLAKKGYKVDVFEKNHMAGGRAQVLRTEDYTFDMGPSWYMMPDVFEEFFTLLGEDISDYLQLKKLSPSYRVFMESDGSHHDFYADREQNAAIFEAIEPGAGKKLDEYLDESARQYQIAKHEFIYKNYDSILDFFTLRVMKEGRKLEIYRNMEQIIHRTFTSELLRKVMMFQMVLLGTAPKDAPGMYRLMNHVDFDLGIWYPDGGIGKLPQTIERIAKKHGTVFHFNSPVEKILTKKAVACGIKLAGGEEVYADIVVSDADMHHTETKLLEKELRERDETYWNKRTLAPSALIMYLGVSKTFPSLTHHNLLFSNNWDKNFKQIFNHADFPESPSIYVCAPSKTDKTVAPLGHENLFVLVPISAGITYTAEQLEEWSKRTLKILEEKMHLPGLQEHLTFKKIYSAEDFSRDYHSFKGSALGLAHTLSQSALWRPNNISKKVKNLYYVGSYTNPGIGMPTCVVSAQTAYKRIVGIKHPNPLTEL
jgi:phytoene desaturase